MKEVMELGLAPWTELMMQPIQELKLVPMKMRLKGILESLMEA